MNKKQAEAFLRDLMKVCAKYNVGISGFDGIPGGPFVWHANAPDDALWGFSDLYIDPASAAMTGDDKRIKVGHWRETGEDEG